MGRIFRFSILLLVKLLATLFYRYHTQWLEPREKNDFSGWQEVSLIVFLNHTSLYEPLFLRLAPVGFLWKIAEHLVVPGADITLKRPFAGKLLTFIVPGVIAISRKKDDSWQSFLQQIHPNKINAILPEGRMKRRNGLDKYGKPMTIRGGVADILQMLNSGKMLVVISGGLHHIQAPGDHFPKLFKTIKANLILVDIAQYKAQFNQQNTHQFKQQVIADLQHKLDTCQPI